MPELTNPNPAEQYRIPAQEAVSYIETPSSELDRARAAAFGAAIPRQEVLDTANTDARRTESVGSATIEAVSRLVTPEAAQFPADPKTLMNIGRGVKTIRDYELAA